jgi:hypothetical protein
MTTPAQTAACNAAHGCTYLVRHAINSQQRAQVSQALGCARSIGDQYGILIALAQLTGSCPAGAPG